MASSWHRDICSKKTGELKTI